MASGQPQLFSGGGHTANLMLSTDLLQQAWSSLSEHHNNLMEIDNQEATFTIKTLTSPIKATVIAFSGPTTTPLEAKLEPLDDSHPLAFLKTRDNKKISIHQSILPIFSNLLENSQLHEKLKESLGKESPQLILVGQGLGGSIADLFTIWALKNRHPLCPVPICITFGAPFVGNEGLRRAIAKNDRWLTRFWHVAAHDDVFSRLFLVPKLSSTSLMPLIPNCPDDFKPFGTYVMLSDSGCTCVTDPESILQYMELSTPPHLLVIDIVHKDYGAMLEQLLLSIMFMQASQPTPSAASSALATDLELQLNASGVHADNPNYNTVVTEAEKRERDTDRLRKSIPSPAKRLNEAKKQMALLEWYKKECEKNGLEYYDSFKGRLQYMVDIDANRFRNILTAYWKDIAEETSNKPQTPEFMMRTGSLYAAATYRRMAECLDIADFYRKHGHRDYIEKGRSPHHILLQKWYVDDPKVKASLVKIPDQPVSLTEDSCFWAHVEEAKLDLEDLKDGRGDVLDLGRKFKEFEDYLMNLVKRNGVSPNIFFKMCSFMAWWNDYEKVLEHEHQSEFTEFMKSKKYLEYK